MESYHFLVQKARDQIRNNKIRLAFKTSRDLLTLYHCPDEFTKKLISLERKEKDIDRKEKDGLIKKDDEQVERNLIVKSLLDLISDSIDEINTPKGNMKDSHTLLARVDDLKSALDYHKNFIRNWSSEIAFKDLRGVKNIEEVYIDLEITLTPRSLHVNYSNYDTETFKIQELIPLNQNLVILGDPGAGKTTTLKFVSQHYFLSDLPENIKFSFPILIRLRDLAPAEYIYDRLATLLNISDKIFTTLGVEEQDYLNLSDASKYNFKKIIINHIEYLQPLILLDGLDELNFQKQEQIFSEINFLLLHIKNAKVILTCRSGAFNFTFEKVLVYELCYLNSQQIKEFVFNWLRDPRNGKKLLMQLKKSPFRDTAARPLILAHLCALFERYKRIPDKPKSVYKKIVMLLLEEWDSQRGIVRVSKYAKFDIDRKLEFLSNLAFELTTSFENKVYSKVDFKIVYEKIYINFSLELREANKVFKEIEAHNGIVIQSSYDTFEFSHKSIQEYLAAEFLVRMPIIPRKIIFDTNIMNELAIAVCLASNSTEYFCHLIFEVLDSVEQFNNRRVFEFLTRLLQEKPDFVISKTLGIAFFTIYNNFILDQYLLEPRSSDFSEDNRTFLNIYKGFLKFEHFKISIYQLKDFMNKTKLVTDSFYHNDLHCISLEVDDEVFQDLSYYKIPQVYCTTIGFVHLGCRVE